MQIKLQFGNIFQISANDSEWYTGGLSAREKLTFLIFQPLPHFAPLFGPSTNAITHASLLSITIIHLKSISKIIFVAKKSNWSCLWARAIYFSVEASF